MGESSLAQYARQSLKFQQMPKNEWEHGEGLLHSEYAKEDEDLTISQIMDKYLQTCNIADDTLMRLIQCDANIISHFQDMADREPMLKPFYRLQLHAWRNELLATKMFKGKERGHQAAIGTRKQEQQPYGFGQTFGEEPAEEKPQNFFQRMFSSQKKQ